MNLKRLKNISNFHKLVTSKFLEHRKMLWKSHEINFTLRHAYSKYFKPNSPHTRLQRTGLAVLGYVRYTSHQSKTLSCLHFKSNCLINC
jgi:hypothetical protein